MLVFILAGLTEIGGNWLVGKTPQWLGHWSWPGRWDCFVVGEVLTPR